MAPKMQPVQSKRSQHQQSLAVRCQVAESSSAAPSSSAAANIELAQKLHINATAFNLAIKGYEKLKQTGQITNQRYLTIADMSMASSHPRLYIIDMEKQQVLLQTFVAHGRNSGLLFAKQFSNGVQTHINTCRDSS